MVIEHPLLGPRDAAEFVYLGDASLMNRPDPLAENAAETFYEYQYLRDNPAGEHRELWYHEQGDRSWLVVTRNTLTHEILKVELARDVKMGMARKSAPPKTTSRQTSARKALDTKGATAKKGKRA
jgi:sarcosine oxidase subunit delta